MKKYPVEVEDDVHKDAKEASNLSDRTLKRFLKDAVKNEIGRTFNSYEIKDQIREGEGVDLLDAVGVSLKVKEDGKLDRGEKFYFDQSYNSADREIIKGFNLYLGFSLDELEVIGKKLLEFVEARKDEN